MLLSRLPAARGVHLCGGPTLADPPATTVCSCRPSACAFSAGRQWQLKGVLGLQPPPRLRIPHSRPHSSLLAFLPQDDYAPGDLSFDPLGLKPTDPANLKDMQTRELNNGRLAMLSIIAFWLQELRDPNHTSE